MNHSWLIYTHKLFFFLVSICPSCIVRNPSQLWYWSISVLICVIRFSALNLFYDTHSSPHRFQPQVNTPHLHSRCGRRSSGLSVGPILIISISHILSSAAPPPPVSSLFWSRRSSGGLSEFDSLHKQWVWLLSTTGKDSTIDKGLKHIQACWADSGLVQKL